MIKASKFLKSIKIRTKVILLYISVLILSLLLTYGIFTIMSERQIEQEVGEAAMQTVSALKGNLDFIFENVNQFSDLIYFDKDVQSALSKINSSNINPHVQQTMQKSMVNMLLSGDYISGVFIFDTYNNYYNSYKSGPISVNKDIIKETYWYQKTKEAEGDVVFIHKSEDVLTFPTKKDKNYISLVREIYDVDTYDELATLLIIVDEETIQDYFEEVGKKYNSQFCIVDSNNNYIIRPNGYDKSMDEYIFQYSKDENGYRTLEADRNKMIVAMQELGIGDWKLIGTIPLNLNNISVSKAYRTWIVLIISLNLFFIFACSVALTNLIFKPLNRVQKHMKMVQGGKLIQMEVNEKHSDEINDLKKVFNQMVDAIDNLISEVKKEEQIIAKNELDIIQAQINPHFLYNTLDAVSALALIEDNENCLKMTQALGNFYRNSLNSGLDLVSIQDEMECIESYITILNMRYDNKINMTYDVEEDIKELKILKLILQPIVENAAHHGIRNKKGKGTISIKGYRDEDEVIFIVTDDGLGMSEDRIHEIVEGKIQKEKSGFGLYSSAQRISLYYGIEKPITITSELGNGTEITIRVKVI
ncbi:sensor histidine kinase [Anaerocolumna aminovalerica]|uniref:cache domain-containing sensor histidine kinase n=1 Tax=Anaerocolumna aminovalerica TaxID=1527 RepID=UPI00147FB761|nr:sensor histidine kinase [Anaerocolumna aminovalerica]MBU5333845.1 sensor histidine kinase [Anaerocolumna aminovalerica]MDU6265686.1 sensor histidine kinase [Anaerocolumna aminovalerica]